MTLISRLGAPGSVPRGDGPAYLWLAGRIRTDILDGALLVGQRVPSERDIARQLGLSRTTASAAYVLLRAEGFLHSRPGSNTVAALPRTAIARPDDVRLGAERPDVID